MKDFACEERDFKFNREFNREHMKASNIFLVCGNGQHEFTDDEFGIHSVLHHKPLNKSTLNVLLYPRVALLYLIASSYYLSLSHWDF